MIQYIVGLGRSGTTVFTEYAATHYGAATAGEIVNVFSLGVIRNELCQCGAPFWECEFWRSVGDAAFGGWSTELAHDLVAILKARDNPSTGYRALLGALTAEERRDIYVYTSAHLAICDAARAITGAEALVDSSKHPAVCAWLASASCDVSILHLVRDSRGVAWSWSHKVERPESGSDLTYMDQFSLARSARLWNMTNLVSEAVRLRFRRSTRVRYEDFCHDPVAASMRAFSEVTDHTPQLCPTSIPRNELRHAPHAMGGNPMRFSNGTSRVSKDELWRIEMPVKDLRRVTRRTAVLLRSYGYRITGSAGRRADHTSRSNRGGRDA
jgi:hypothetical protein